MKPKPAEIPDRVLEWANRATEAGLTEPLGRALCLHSRALNTKIDRRTPLSLMEGVKYETAVRWREHWLNGGSFKTLSRTVEQQRAHERASAELRRLSQMSESDQLRYRVRKIRRAASKGIT